MAARKTNTKMMPDLSSCVYSFTFVLSGSEEASLEIADALYEAGCDDATIYSRDGVLYAAFDREAPTPTEAIGSALRDVEATGLLVTRIDPDDSPGSRSVDATRSLEAFQGLLDLVNAALQLRQTPGRPGAAGVGDLVLRGAAGGPTFRIPFGPVEENRPEK
ncbi:hypothetical protein BH23PLA1_BH23PLA1_00550 [soil metagenome]